MSAVSEAAVRLSEFEKGVFQVGRWRSLKRMVVVDGGTEARPVGCAASCEELDPRWKES